MDALGQNGERVAFGQPSFRAIPQRRVNPANAFLAPTNRILQVLGDPLAVLVGRALLEFSLRSALQIH